MNCSQCDAQFESVIKSQIYCSRQCRGLAWYYKHEGAKPKRHTCEQCDIQFVHKFKHVKFCSKNCSDKYYRNKRREKLREWGRKYTRRGDSAFNTIKQRCTNPNSSSYKYYGAKGVECKLTKQEFKSIYFRTKNCEVCEVKLSDKNRRGGKNSRTIDRIDPNSHYEIHNVQVICRSCQSRRANASRKRT